MRPEGRERRITEAEAHDLLREYLPRVRDWATAVIRRRVHGHLRQRALAQIAPAVPAEVWLVFTAAVRRGSVLATNPCGFLYLLTERTAVKMVVKQWQLDRREILASEAIEPANDNGSPMDPESALIARETEAGRAVLLRAAQTAFDRLSPRDRRLVEARMADAPVPFAALGPELGISAEAARIAYFRAVRRLRRRASAGGA